MLGSFTGPNGVTDHANRVRYFHYNDLGTVMAQTKANATVEGVWEPNWCGNYRWRYSASPARPKLGLTGKMYDEAAGLYYFNARWYDPERGRWMSEDNVRKHNLYEFNRSIPYMLIDPNGRSPFLAPHIGGGPPAWHPAQDLDLDFAACRRKCLQETQEKRHAAEKNGERFACGSQAESNGPCMVKCLKERGWNCEWRLREGFIALPIGFFHAVAQVKCDIPGDWWRTADSIWAPIIGWTDRSSPGGSGFDPL